MVIYSRWVDFWLILFPPFLGAGLLLAFPDFFNRPTPMVMGLILNIALAIGHQFSMGFRTYFDFDELKQRPILYAAVPVVSFLLAFFLFDFGDLVYWRVISYIAIIHFVRQQYGFMAIYRKPSLNVPDPFAFLDTLFIYTSMAYPLLYEHMHAPRRYSWADIDVIVPLYFGSAEKFFLPTFLVIATAYFTKELFLYFRTRFFNLEKNLVIVGTALVWYVGLVATNADFSFFFSTQLMHSVPYIALVWMYGNKKYNGKKLIFTYKAIPLYLGAILTLAYFETGLWSSYAGDDLKPYFEIFTQFGQLDPKILRWLVPLITVPQLTHYFLDAYIWRLRKGDQRWMINLWKTNSPIEATTSVIATNEPLAARKVQ
jgi:hypothetical protein